MPLYLIPMLIHTPEEISAPMNIEHDPLAIFLRAFPLLIVRPHLDPFSFEVAPFSAPLPPFAATDLINTLMTQLSDYCIGSIVDCFLGNCDFFYPAPGRVGHPLRGKGLNVFDGMIGGVYEKAADEVKTLMVRNVCCGLLAQGFAIEVLWHFQVRGF